MTYSVRILPTAEKELDEAISYLSKYSRKAAKELLEAYASQIDLLSQGIVEYGFSRIPELARLGYRVALVGNYLFLYYIENRTLTIAHFFHQKQDYGAMIVSPQ